MLKDLRFAMRVLLKKGRFTIPAIVVTALAIGLNTSLFGIVDAWLLRPLPFPQPERLASIWMTEPGSPGLPSFFASSRTLNEWSRQSSSFESLAGYFGRSVTITGSARAERALGLVVTENLFSTLGVSALLGRTFVPSDLNGPPVVVLSYGLWQQRYGGSSAVIGKAIQLNDTSYIVVGVMPQKFSVPTIYLHREREQFWVLLLPADEPYRSNPDSPIGIIGRLNDGRNPAGAQGELSSIYGELEKNHRPQVQGLGVLVAGLQSDLTRTVKPSLLVLLMAALFTLLIACANVASLLLGRASDRQKEMAIRSALGAGRWALMRLALTESLLLSVVGGMLSLGISASLLRYFLASNPFQTPSINDAALDWRVLFFVLALIVFTGFLFGGLPAFQASRPDVNEVLKEGRLNFDFRSARARSWLVVGEVGLSLVLLIGAGLMLESFVWYTSAATGFQTGNILTF